MSCAASARTAIATANASSGRRTALKSES
jgi:hypothetical protein